MTGAECVQVWMCVRIYSVLLCALCSTRCVKLDGRMSFEARDRCIAAFAGDRCIWFKT